MSIDSQWHIERSQEILGKHPEIKQYFGHYPPSILAIAFLVALQWLIALLVKDLPWYLVGAIAFFVGQFILHSFAPVGYNRYMPESNSAITNQK